MAQSLNPTAMGTTYVLTANAVNRDENGYVDFEKMHGLEGVAMINVVSNVRQVDGGEKEEAQIYDYPQRWRRVGFPPTAPKSEQPVVSTNVLGLRTKQRRSVHSTCIPTPRGLTSLPHSLASQLLA